MYIYIYSFFIFGNLYRAEVVMKKPSPRKHNYFNFLFWQPALSGNGKRNASLLLRLLLSYQNVKQFKNWPRH